MPARQIKGRTRRALSNDEIEEDRLPEKRRQRGDVEDAERASSSLNVNRRNANDKSARKVDDSDESDLQDDQDDAIDVENFKDQPIDTKEAIKFMGIQTDWEKIRTTIHTHSFDMMNSTAAAIGDNMEGDEKDTSLAKLDIIIKELLDIDEEIITYETTAREIHQQVIQGVPLDGAHDIYERLVKKSLNEYRNQTSRQKYAKKKQYFAFREAIWEAEHNGEGMPPISQFIPKEPGDLSDDDDELEIGGATQTFKCPLTMTAYIEPVTSRKCGHSFSKTSIHDYLQMNRRGMVKCPATGCNDTISISDLFDDRALAKKAQLAEKRQRRREAEAAAHDDADIVSD